MVSIGDSFTEGLGDIDSRYPNGVRGWADRVAERMAAINPEFRYANLAIRGKKIEAIIQEQLKPAIALKSDVITFFAGANDLIRPKVDLDMVIEKIDYIAKTLTQQTQAKILTFTASDLPPGLYSTILRGRYAFFNEYLREIAEKYSLTVIDYWRMHSQYKWDSYWSDDQIHMSTKGHGYMAEQVLDTLGYSTQRNSEFHQQQSEELRFFGQRFFRTTTLPWLIRRIRKISSGDNLQPKYPILTKPLSFLP